MGTVTTVVFAFIAILSCCCAQEPPKRPTFPDTFETEVQGIFKAENEEVDATIYYDRTQNKAALYYTYQNDSTISIYNFDDGELIYIQGSECSVTKLSDHSEESFFPFSKDKKGKKILAPPEEIFYFTNSVLERQDISIFPVYIYTGKKDFPQYGRKGCELSHVFSKPEVELPDCDSHSCMSTLVAISVMCKSDNRERTDVDHVYNFFRFRTGISNPSAFNVPVGVHCSINSHSPFPILPDYFSFSYDIFEEYMGEDVGGSSYVMHKKVWHDRFLKLIRMDEFDDNNLLASTRIIDLYSGTAYTIMSGLSDCEMGPIPKDVRLYELSDLPEAFFATNAPKDVVYIGKKDVHGFQHDVWSSSFEDKETDARKVEQFYFKKNFPKDETKSDNPYLQISHANLYTYERGEETNVFELSMQTHISFNNYRSKPKEWEAFDISTCFTAAQRKGFKLKVKGPPIIRDSILYHMVLEKLYLKLIIATNVSVVRISELTGVFDAVNVVEFTGWILENPNVNGSNVLEPDMNTAYNIIEEAASAGKLSMIIILNDDAQEFKYIISDFTEHNVKYDSKGNCFSGGSLAGVGISFLVIGIVFSVITYYVYLKKRNMATDKLPLQSIAENY